MFGYSHIGNSGREAYKSNAPPSENGGGASITSSSTPYTGRTLGRLSQSNTYDEVGKKSRRSHRDDGGSRRGRRFTDDDFSRTLDEYDMATRKEDKPRSASSGHDKRHSHSSRHREDNDRHRREDKDDGHTQRTNEAERDDAALKKTFDRDRFLKSVMEGKYASTGNGSAASTIQEDESSTQQQQPLEFGHASKNRGPLTGKIGSDGFEDVTIHRLDWAEFTTPQSAIFIGPKRSGKTSILMNMFAAIVDRFDFVFIFCGAASTAKQLMQLTFPAFVTEEFEPDMIRQIMRACNAVLDEYGFMPSVALLIDDYLTEAAQAKNSVWPTVFKKAHQFGISSFYAVHDVGDIHHSARPSAGMISIGYNATEAMRQKAYAQFFKLAFETYKDFNQVYEKTVFDRGQSLVLMDTPEYGFQVRYLRSDQVTKLEPYTLCSRDCYVLMHMFGKDPSTWRKKNTGGVEIDNAAVDKMKMAFTGNPEDGIKAAQEEEDQREKTVVSHRVQAAMDKAQKLKKSLSPQEITALSGKRFIIAD